jgi:hypothetical protein
MCVVLYSFFCRYTLFNHMEVSFMQSREQELFEKLFSPHNRRDFIKRDRLSRGVREQYHHWWVHTNRDS